jgi:hypothetical protein
MEKNVKRHYAEWRYTESRGALLTDNSSLSSPPSFVPFAAEKKFFYTTLFESFFFFISLEIRFFLNIIFAFNKVQ